MDAFHLNTPYTRVSTLFSVCVCAYIICNVYSLHEIVVMVFFGLKCAAPFKRFILYPFQVLLHSSNYKLSLDFAQFTGFSTLRWRRRETRLKTKRKVELTSNKSNIYIYRTAKEIESARCSFKTDGMWRLFIFLNRKLLCQRHKKIPFFPFVSSNNRSAHTLLPP